MGPDQLGINKYKRKMSNIGGKRGNEVILGGTDLQINKHFLSQEYFSLTTQAQPNYKGFSSNWME